MDSTAVIWIIVVIAAALIAVVVIGFFVYRRNQGQRDQRRHEQAEDMRRKARESAIAAQEIEANRAQKQADAAAAAAEAERAKAQAAQAELDARRYTAEHGDEVDKHRAEEEAILQKADAVDPYGANGKDGSPHTPAPVPDSGISRDERVSPASGDTPDVPPPRRVRSDGS